MRVRSILRIVLRLSIAALCFAAALFVALMTAVLAAAGIVSYAAVAFAVMLVLAWGGVRFGAVHKPLVPG